MLIARKSLKGAARGPKTPLITTLRKIGAVSRGDELREVMRRYPVGISVVTVDLEGERLGLTVASLVPLALEPPLVGISIARQAALHELVRAAGGFAVSLLGAEQRDLAQHFARGVPPIVLWQGIDVLDGQRGPLLGGALGWLECELSAEHEAGDHTLFVGLVERAEPGEQGEPLLRLGGDYA
jgi:flavin reductase (DIM6/NTAB) family NADH-FMN oxidoreductase RutF